MAYSVLVAVQGSPDEAPRFARAHVDGAADVRALAGSAARNVIGVRPFVDGCLLEQDMLDDMELLPFLHSNADTARLVLLQCLWIFYLSQHWGTGKQHSNKSHL